MKNLAIENVKEVKDFQEWMPCPKVDTDCPGLAYIYPLDELVVAKKLDALHDVIGRKDVSYTIFNNLGQKVFLAVQEKKFKKFDLKIFNYYGNEVIQVRRPFRFCLNGVAVWAPPGNFVGSVEQICCRNTFLVKNKTGKVVSRIRARSIFNLVYNILWANEEIGVVMKWRMAVLNVKNFGVTFPINMDIADKALLLGAGFLIGCLKY